MPALKFPSVAARNSRRIVAVEFNPYQILAVEISRPHRGAVVVEATAEFDREDTAGLGAWLEANDGGRRAWTIAICGLVPLRGMVQRETVQPARLAEAGYLETVVQEQQKGRFLTATPFKIGREGAWTYSTVNAVAGTPLTPDSPPQPALICALANDDVHETQQRLLEQRLIRDRIEPGVYSLFGAIYDIIERRGDMRAVVVVIIHESVTAAYILGKEGVHTPNPVLHGLHSIVDVARKETGGTNDFETLAELEKGNPDLLNLAPKLVRRIGRDLKPVVDSFEMTTGQPVDEILCAYLPPKLRWLGDELAQATGRKPFALDYNEWLPKARLEMSAGAGNPAFGPNWLGALNLVANLPEVSGLKFDRQARVNRAYQRPWHVDCSIRAEADDHRLTGRRFLGGVLAGALALFMVVLAAWQLYVDRSLRADTQFWESQMAGNHKLLDELAAANVTLKKQTEILDRDYELMAAPLDLTDLVMNLGRTVPPHLRVDRINSSDQRVAVGGTLLEPAEVASETLRRYVEELRHNPAIGPLFSSIAITTLQRQKGDEGMAFELTLRLAPTAP